MSEGRILLYFNNKTMSQNSALRRGALDTLCDKVCQWL